VYHMHHLNSSILFRLRVCSVCSLSLTSPEKGFTLVWETTCPVPFGLSKITLQIKRDVHRIAKDTLRTTMQMYPAQKRLVLPGGDIASCRALKIRGVTFHMENSREAFLQYYDPFSCTVVFSSLDMVYARHDVLTRVILIHVGTSSETAT